MSRNPPALGKVPVAWGAYAQQWLGQVKQHLERSAATGAITQAQLDAAVAALTAKIAAVPAANLSGDAVLALLDGRIGAEQLDDDLAERLGVVSDDEPSPAELLEGNLSALAELQADADQLAYFDGPESMALTAFTAYARSWVAAADKNAAAALLPDALKFLALLTPAANKLPWFDSASSAALTDLSAYGRSWVAAADAATATALLTAAVAAIGPLSPAADKLAYYTGSGTAALTTLTAFMRTLLDDIDAATARATLGVTIGTHVQAWDADLDAIAALAGTSGLARKTAANTWSLDTATYLTGNQTITLSGDVSGSGATAITVTLPSIVVAGTNPKITYNAKGQVTGGEALLAADIPALDWSKISTGKPTTLSGYGITDAQPLDGDLTAIAALAGTTGLARKTAANTWSLDTAAYLTAEADTLATVTGRGATTTTPLVISANSASDALTITQTGAGNALVVEDSTNPDGSPFVVDTTGRVLVGNTVAYNTQFGASVVTPKVQISDGAGNALLGRWSADAFGSTLHGLKSRSPSVAAYGTAVKAGDSLLRLSAAGDDGTQAREAARISMECDGTVASGSVPGSIVLMTTAPGTATPTGVLRVDSAAAVTITGNGVIEANTVLDALRITQVGTGNALLVQDAANPDSTPVVVDTSGRVIVGATDTGADSAFLQVHGGGGANKISWYQYSADGGCGRLRMHKTRSATKGSFAIVADGDLLTDMYCLGDDGAAFQTAARLVCQVDGTPAAGSMPGRWMVYTTPSGSVTSSERLRIDNAGNVTVRGGKFGYALGGGAVTQLTSKSTGVTLNKVCGQITLNNAALAAGAVVSFTVTNSTVEATDTIIANIGSGGTVGAYALTVSAVGAGSFSLSLRNESAGSLSEAVVVNFSILKAVNA